MSNDCPPQCPCYFGDQNNRFEIRGYTDGDIPADDCHLDPDATTWGGTFATRIAPCKWNSSEDNYKLDGDHMLCEPGTSVYFVEGDPSGKWVARVSGYDENGGEIVLWQGEKEVGDTPEGEYTRVSGSCTSILELQVDRY